MPRETKAILVERMEGERENHRRQVEQIRKEHREDCEKAREVARKELELAKQETAKVVGKLDQISKLYEDLFEKVVEKALEG